MTFIFVVSFVSFTTFVTVCYSLRFSMKVSIVSINLFFFQGFLHHGFRHTDKLVQFKFLWLSLCRLTQDLGRSMGLTYAVLTLHCFGVLVIASYGFLVSIRNEFSELTLSLAFAMMVTLATLFIQCTVAQSASEEVSSQKRIKGVICTKGAS